jgi:hypothetical protein
MSPFETLRFARRSIPISRDHHAAPVVPACEATDPRTWRIRNDGAAYGGCESHEHEVIFDDPYAQSPKILTAIQKRST